MFPPFFIAGGVYLEFYSSATLFFLQNLMWYFSQKEVSEQGIIAFKADRSARQAKYLAAGNKDKKLL